MKSFFVFLFFVVCAFAVPANWYGVLRPDGSYIPGAVLVWAENANIAKRWSDPNGIPILTEWHDAVYKYDNAMIANQTMDALGNFYIISACLKLAQPHIRNYQCRQWFAETTVGFGAVVRGLGTGTVSIAQANAYMIKEYPRFQQACGSPQLYSNNYYYYQPNYPCARRCVQ